MPQKSHQDNYQRAATDNLSYQWSGPDVVIVQLLCAGHCSRGWKWAMKFLTDIPVLIELTFNFGEKGNKQICKVYNMLDEYRNRWK